MPTTEISVKQYARQILQQVSSVISGKEQVLLWVLTAMLARGTFCWKISPA